MKADKMPYLTYTVIDSLIKKIDGYVSNPEKSSTTKLGEHIPCEYSMSTIWAFDHLEQSYFISLGRFYKKVL